MTGVLTQAIGYALAAAALVTAAAAWAQTPPAAAEKRIVAGPGAGLVATKCAICHDLTHITRSRLGQFEWEDTVQLMVNRGLVISPEETKTALNYLTQFYGPKGPPADAPYFGAVATLAGAPGVPQLLATNGCTGCHAVDRRVVGPSFKDIASKYSGQPDRVTHLVRAVREGSVGRWGAVPMPALSGVSPSEAEALVHYLLSHK